MMRLMDRIQAVLFWPVMLAVFGAYFAKYAFPASYWFEVKQVFVHDSVEGVPPKITFSRDIWHDFNGHWDVIVKSVQNVEGSGHLLTVCESNGPAHGRIEKEIDPNLDLDKWTWPIKCLNNMPPGTYIMETVWMWWGWGAEHSVAFTSPAFKMYAAGTDPKLLK